MADIRSVTEQQQSRLLGRMHEAQRVHQLGLNMTRYLDSGEFRTPANAIALRLLREVDRFEDDGIELWLAGRYLQASALGRSIYEYSMTAEWVLHKPEHAERFLSDDEFRVAVRDMPGAFGDNEGMAIHNQFYDAASKWVHPRHHVMMVAGQFDGYHEQMATETGLGLSAAFGIAFLPFRRLTGPPGGLVGLFHWTEAANAYHSEVIRQDSDNTN